MSVTEKQVSCILFLLHKKGFDTRFMGSQFKHLGATMRERRGTVEAWVRDLDKPRASEVIGLLDQMKDRK